MHLETIPEKWDLVVVGGGVTGAGIFRLAAGMNLKVLLVEQKDFAWGTSSRSSKLIHGGLRYLKEGRLLLTRESVQERERLLEEAPGLVEPLEFLVPVYKDRGPGKWTLEAGLSLYDLIARKHRHQFLSKEEFLQLAPYVDQKLLIGGFCFFDARVDDARLVMRLINEAVQLGGCALNYTAATDIYRNAEGGVTGIRVEDTETGAARTLSTLAIINAGGIWAEKLHPPPQRDFHMRPLRGSHLVYPSRVLPVDRAISFIHPADGRAVFVIPWQGAVLVGTTDLDHENDLSIEPAAAEKEVIYLVRGLAKLFPSLDFSLKNCIASFAGVRPVVSSGDRAPSSEPRDHMIWTDKGLVTVTGGKMTIFRAMARDALKAAAPCLPPVEMNIDNEPIFAPLPVGPANNFGLSSDTWRYLYGRYGPHADTLVRNSSAEDLKPIPGTETLWAEIPFVAGKEQVRHLDDLLLRRVRIGLLTPGGGRAHIRRIKQLCRPVLPWSRKRWRQEIKRYLELWEHAHGLPPGLTEARPGRRPPSIFHFRAFLRHYYRKLF